MILMSHVNCITALFSKFSKINHQTKLITCTRIPHWCHKLYIVLRLVSHVHRETKEECGLDVSDLDKVGTLIFEFVGEPQLLEVHVFRTEHFTGTVTESEGELLLMSLISIISSIR